MTRQGVRESAALFFGICSLEMLDIPYRRLYNERESSRNVNKRNFRNMKKIRRTVYELSGM